MATEQALRYIVEVQDRDLKELKKTVSDTNQEIGDGVDKAGTKGAAGLGKLKTAAVVGAGVVGGALVVGAKKAVDAASDLGEQVSKNTVIFGKQAPALVSWSKTTATSLGLSQRAALEATGTFGNMLVPMGIGKTRAAQLSKGMVTLAGDMASFNNASPAETLDALRAGLSGETEPLRRFGVFLNEGTIKAKALSLGLVKAEVDTAKLGLAQIAVRKASEEAAEALKKHGKTSNEYRDAVANVAYQEGKVQKLLEGKVPALSASDKALATNAVIMEQTKNTQGDFARTSGSVANQQRIMAAQLENTAASFGSVLLPAVQTLLPVVGKLLGTLAEHRSVAIVLVGVLAGLAFTVLAVAAAMKVYAAFQAIASAATALFGKEGLITRAVLTGWTAAQWLLNAAVAGFPLILILAALVAVGIGLVLLWKKSETFRDIVTGAFDVVRGAANAVLNFFRNNWRLIATLISGPFAPLVFLATDAFGVRSAIEGAFTSAKNFVGARIDDVVGFVRALPGRLAGFVDDLRSKATNPIANTFDPITDVLGKIRTGANWLIEHLVKGLATVASGLAKPLKALADSFGALWDKLKPIIDAFKWIVENVKKIESVIEKLGGVVGAVASKIPGVGDVAAGMNAGAARAARPGYAVGGLAPSTQAYLNTLNRLFDEFTVASGRRTPEQNREVGGATHSDHLTGHAFDIVPKAGWSAGSIAHFDRIAAYAAMSPIVRWIGWRGVPGHGPYDHLHISTYDSGGWLMPGATLALNKTGVPERVVGPGDAASPLAVYVTVEGSVITEEELVDAVYDGVQKRDRRNAR